MASANAPAHEPDLLNHVVKHGFAPVFVGAAQILLTGALPGASGPSGSSSSAKSAASRLALTKDPGTIDQMWHFSGLITKATNEAGRAINLDEVEEFSDAMLTAIAAEGHAEMTSLLDQSKATKAQRPFAMTALIAEGELYLSSSIKKNYDGFRALFPKSPVSDSLERCSIFKAPLAAKPELQASGQVHRTGGNCGEPGALQMYFMRRQNAGKHELPKGARIVTWDGKDVMDPCGPLNQKPTDRLTERMIPPNLDDTAEPWGCERLTTELNVRAILKNVSKIDSTPVPAGWKLKTTRFDKALAVTQG